MNRFLSIVLIIVGCTIWMSEKAYSTSLLPCERLLDIEGEGQEQFPEKVAEIESNFIDVGLRRIGNSSLFLSGTTVTEILPNGTVRFYFEEFYLPVDWMNRTSETIERLSAEKGVLGIGYGSALPGIYSSEYAHSPVHSNFLESAEAKLPMLVQLLVAGFRSVADSLGLYQYSSSEPGRNILAFVVDDKLVHLFREMPKYKSDELPEKFRLIDIAHGIYDNGRVREAVSNITLTDDKVNFTITSLTSNKGNITKLEIIDPMTENHFVEQETFWPETIIEPQSLFAIGGKNTSEIIKQAKTLNGISISNLEDELRPGQSSMAGFLGETESLADVLITDNNYVLGELGLTHQQLAQPLRFAQRVWEKEYRGNRLEVIFDFKGRKYKVQGVGYRGYQDSPFSDKTMTRFNITVTNLANNAEVTYSGLVPDMIYRYGFYEGKGTPYRVEPKDIVAVFDFLLH